MHRQFPIGSIITNKEILEFISSVTKPWSTIKKSVVTNVTTSI
jgi:hypothetical protein